MNHRLVLPISKVVVDHSRRRSTVGFVVVAFKDLVVVVDLGKRQSIPKPEICKKKKTEEEEPEGD